jgi:N-acetylglucosaminyldiphosphoundecaprenol N-acetyl-beta-D-mannosaminyltransferase
MSSPASPPARLELFGTQVHALSLEAALEWVHERIVRRSPAYVVTLNGALLVRAARDPELRALINGAGLVTADGIGVILAARIVGLRLPERVAGIDLMMGVLARAAAAGWRIYLLGGAPGVAQAAAAAAQRRHPGLQIVGADHGFFSAEDEGAIATRIRAARPDVLFVAMGAPRQERWAQRWSPALEVPVAIGVGGSFDVLAGRISRAPRWMQRAGFEWLYRALREPRRWAVIKTIPPLFLLALRERLRQR